VGGLETPYWQGGNEDFGGDITDTSAAAENLKVLAQFGKPGLLAGSVSGIPGAVDVASSNNFTPTPNNQPAVSNSGLPSIPPKTGIDPTKAMSNLAQPEGSSNFVDSAIDWLKGIEVMDVQNALTSGGMNVKSSPKGITGGQVAAGATMQALRMFSQGAAVEDVAKGVGLTVASKVAVDTALRTVVSSQTAASIAGPISAAVVTAIKGGDGYDIAESAIMAAMPWPIQLAVMGMKMKQAQKSRTENKQLYESAKFTKVIRGVSELAGVSNFSPDEWSALIESVGLADPIGVTPDMAGANAASAGAAFLAKYPKLTPGTEVASLDDGNRLKGDARRATGRLAAIMRLPGMQENFDAFYNGKMSKEEFSSRSTAAVNKFKVDNAAKISSAAAKASNERILAMDVDPDGPQQDITAQRDAKASQVKYAAINAEAVVPEIVKAKQVATDLRAEAVAQQAAGIPYYDRGRAIQAAQNAEKRVAELLQYQAQQRFITDHDKPEMWETVSYGDEDEQARTEKYYDLLVATGMPDPRTWDEEMEINSYPSFKSVWGKNTFNDNDDIGGGPSSQDEMNAMSNAGTGSIIGDLLATGQEIAGIPGELLAGIMEMFIDEDETGMTVGQDVGNEVGDGPDQGDE
jgi:hypothetical protein